VILKKNQPIPHAFVGEVTGFVYQTVNVVLVAVGVIVIMMIREIAAIINFVVFMEPLFVKVKKTINEFFLMFLFG
jgi:hypothetical protein